MIEPTSEENTLHPVPVLSASMKDSEGSEKRLILAISQSVLSVIENPSGGIVEVVYMNA